MMHRAWSSIVEVPYCFSRSYVKFQGHTALKIVEFDPNWAFLDCNSSLNSPMAMKCCTKLETAKERCPFVFQGHPSNFKVTRYKTSPILTQIERFRTIGRSQLSNPSDLPCFSLPTDQWATTLPHFVHCILLFDFIQGVVKLAKLTSICKPLKCEANKHFPKLIYSAIILITQNTLQNRNDIPVNVIMVHPLTATKNFIFSCDQAALQMVFSVCLSVRPSVRLSVTPFWLCSHHRIIMKFSGVITNDQRKVHAKGQGQRSKVKVTKVTTQLNRFRTVTPVWIHIWWWNDAYSLMLLRRGALLFFEVVRQISRSHGSKNRRIWPRLGVSGL